MGDTADVLHHALAREDKGARPHMGPVFPPGLFALPRSAVSGPEGRLSAGLRSGCRSVSLCEEGTFPDVQGTEGGQAGAPALEAAGGFGRHRLNVSPKTLFKNTVRDRFFYYSSTYGA